MRENHRYAQAVKNGIDIPEDGYWGDIPSNICGKYGGAEAGNLNIDKVKPTDDNEHFKTTSKTK